MSTVTKHIVTGRVSKTPELSYTPNGTASTSFSLAHQVRKMNRQTNAWEDGELTWYEVQVYGRLAEHVVASVEKGITVTVMGALKLRTYTTRDNRAGASLDLTADDVLISLDHQIARVTERSSYGAKAGSATGAPAPQNQSWQPPAGQAPPAQAGGFGGGFDDEQPF